MVGDFKQIRISSFRSMIIASLPLAYKYKEILSSPSWRNPQGQIGGGSGSDGNHLCGEEIKHQTMKRQTNFSPPMRSQEMVYTNQIM